VRRSRDARRKAAAARPAGAGLAHWAGRYEVAALAAAAILLAGCRDAPLLGTASGTGVDGGVEVAGAGIDGGAAVAAGARAASGVTGAAAGRTAPASAPRRVVATGRIEGWREADVISKLPGRIERFDLEEGDEVEAGAPVVWLERRDLAARLREAEARAEETALALARIRALRAERIVAASELDRARAAALAAAAARDEARATLAYATVTAPFRGTLLRKLKEAGEGVTVNGPPDPLFRLADLSRLKVRAEVPERDIAAVHPGAAAEVSADAYPGESIPARVARVGMAAGRKRLRSDDPRERLDEKVIEVELELAADPRLRSGMTVDVVLGAGAADAREAEGRGNEIGSLTPPPRHRNAGFVRPP
jgi:RND family efflux transporter MFP subunit